ncbi:MAG: NAD kinase [Rhodospirillaceae bacterium]|nr:NAD kinase [Rhodospirillaceae bacterium]
MSRSRIAFIASDAPLAIQAVSALSAAYGQHAPQDADVIVALGGDGFMLEALHNHMNLNVPIFGMHRGTVGFLMNKYEDTGLRERLAAAQEVTLHPLRMDAVASSGAKHSALAINEVSMLRQTRQAAKIRVSIDGRVRMNELICDGALVCTPAGSTAYNLSVHGPVLPIDSNILALTPIAPFRPRRWRGAILPHTASVHFEILERDKRPVSAVADRDEVRDVQSVTVSEDRKVKIRMLFDPEMNLGERILSEQFSGEDGTDLG